MIKSHKVFLESAVLFAFIDRSDSNHQKTVKIMETLAHEHYQLYTSVFNVTETYTALSREIGMSVALEFLETILSSNIEILYLQKSDFISAFKVLKSNKERQINLKEVLNATLMEKRGISQVITFAFWHNLYGTYVSKLTS